MRISDWSSDVCSSDLIPFDPAASSIYLDPPPYPFGGGGLVSSARDYDRFLAMLLGEGQIGGATGGVRVMKAETARRAMANLIADKIGRASCREGVRQYV